QHSVLSCFFGDTATTVLYTLSLHDALPICVFGKWQRRVHRRGELAVPAGGFQRIARGRGHRRRRESRSGGDHRRQNRSRGCPRPDRKSTRLNSSHRTISYAVFCVKKKKHKT